MRRRRLAGDHALDHLDSGANGRLLGDGILRRAGIEMRHDTVAAAPGGETIPTSILISNRLGTYRRDASIPSTPGLPSGVWRPVDGDGPTLVAASRLSHPFDDDIVLPNGVRK